MCRMFHDKSTEALDVSEFAPEINENHGYIGFYKETQQKQRIIRKTMAIIKKNNNVAFWWLSLAFGSKSVKVKRFVRKY